MSGLLEVRHISRAFRTTLAVDDVSFEVLPGELLGLIGPNGAGKSTLFNLIAGVIAPSSGEIIFDGKAISGWKSHDIARVGVARTFQIPKPYRQLSVIENVMLSAFLRREIRCRRAQACGSHARRCRPGRLWRLAREFLTVGLLKRLEVARALAMRPKLVLFDEIMAGLTPTEVGAMTRFVAELPARGITVIWVEHVLYAIMKTATRMIVVNRGKKIADGTPTQLARHPEVVKAYLGEEMDFA